MTKSQRLAIEARLWARIERTDGCWLWHGAATAGGYGHMKIPGTRRTVYVHRLSWMLQVGPIPKGMTVDHVRARGCLSRLCVNTRHLEIVTNRVNILRGTSGPARNARKTSCVRGHPLSGSNLDPMKYGRRCRTCRIARQKARV